MAENSNGIPLPILLSHADDQVFKFSGNAWVAVFSAIQNPYRTATVT
jgi:hypothetical protein